MSNQSQTPITIFRGDDTDAFSLRTITIKLTGDLSLTNATARFTLLGFTKSWTNEETRTGTLTFSLTSQITKSFPLGACLGTLRLYDIEGAAQGSQGKQLTVVNTIPFLVTNVVDGVKTEEYDINVTLAVDTEINIKFEISGGGGESQWTKSPTSVYLYPTENTIQRIVVPALENVSAIGDRYTLADVKNLVNTILASLKV